MGLSKIAVKRPVSTIMVILIVIAVGVLSITNINLDMMPNMNIPIAIVSTTYSGAGPEEVENLITAPLEGALGTVPGVKEITSISSYASSIVVIQFEDSTDINIAALDMREKVDMIKGYLPDDASDPMVLKIDINSMSAISIGVTAENMDLVELKHIVEEKMVNRIERQDGVASVSVSGGREKEISVILNEERLRGYGISESVVSQILMTENLSIPTGSVKQGDKRLTLRVSGEFADIEEIEALPFATSTGAVVYLRDFAEVKETLVDVSSISYINEQPSIMMSVQKQSTANTVKVSDNVRNELDKISQEMPELSIKLILDPADYIRFSLNTVMDSAVKGGILAIIILYVFLRNFRSTLVVAAAMPVSIISTFVLMYYSDITINIMSLGGLTLGVGMLVDNSIVVLESIYRKMEDGTERRTAAIEGAREVASSVVASTLTTIAVFLPISFAGGLTAQIFNQLSLTIGFALVSSLVVSLTFVPMACSLILRVEHVKGQYKRVNIFTKLFDLIGRIITWLEKWYKRLLSFCLRHKALTCIFVAVFVILSLSSLAVVGMEFMPATDEGGISISIQMPKGTLVEETEKLAFEVVDILDGKYPEARDVSISVGGGLMSMFGSSSGDSATISINLVGKTQRNRNADEIAISMSGELENVAGAEITVASVNQAMGSFASGGIDINIKGDYLEELSQIADDFKEIIESVPGTRDVTTSIQDSTPQATIKVNRGKASSYGISAYNVSSIISTAVSGTVATTFKEGGMEYDIRIRQDKSNFDYLSDIQNILVPSPLGVNVPLYELAVIEITDMPVSISRENQQRYVSVSSGLEGRDSGSVMKDISAKLDGYQMPDNYYWEETGTLQQMQETFADLALALIMAVLLVYMIMAAQFESLVYPFIVMFSVPAALSGGIFGLFITNEIFSITSFLGLIMLSGIVVNNAIVLIDYINLLIRERKMTLEEAITTAGPVRLRPILMTTLTTVLALVPMMISQSEGAELMRGLATVVVFGLGISTFITLLFVPVVYMVINNIKIKFKNKRRSRTS